MEEEEKLLKAHQLTGMNTVTSPGPRANPVYVVAPHNSYPVAPGTMPQVPFYPGHQPQVHVISGNLPGLVPAVTELPAQRVLKKGEVLGAMQILIGLVHIGLGCIMLTNLFGQYSAVSLYGGFPFWGGIWLNASVGLNIFSAICSAVGIMLFITDLSILGGYFYPSQESLNVRTGMAISGVLLIFCLVELSIAGVSSHFGCQVTCCNYNNAGVVIPNVCATNPVVFPESQNPIPSYSDAVQDSR
uniref:membrane-spanning 4-domains subfamily A member 8 isoform X3 n=1 Tax=Arvicanthis niloticus TaxID=61156 RepID=UPI001486F471|nr:membrane-spanning 4-domains subfamily A member 8 isoform X3 [Arvicanthis niloticus]